MRREKQLRDGKPVSRAAVNQSPLSIQTGYWNRLKAGNGGHGAATARRLRLMRESARCRACRFTRKRARLEVEPCVPHLAGRGRWGAAYNEKSPYGYSP